jgi:hypothetical protein
MSVTSPTLIGFAAGVEVDADVSVVPDAAGVEVVSELDELDELDEPPQAAASTATDAASAASAPNRLMVKRPSLSM